jgi:hypothetical protein
MSPLSGSPHHREEKLMPKGKSLDPLLRAAMKNVMRIGWQEAHDEFCDFGPECTHHKNPHGEPPED